MKRIFDIIASALALLALSPLLLVIMAILKATGEHEVFFRQARMGKGGRQIRVWKFVTMRKDSAKGGDVTLPGDPRILPIGKFLRDYKINELPQLFNVFLGDMSVIGPRPHAPSTFAYYSEEAKRAILTVKPGLSGIGSLVFRDEEAILAKSGKDFMDCYVNDIAPVKGDLEIWYSRRQGLATDLALVFLTVMALVSRDKRLWERFFPEVKDLVFRPGSPFWLEDSPPFAPA